MSITSLFHQEDIPTMRWPTSRSYRWTFTLRINHEVIAITNCYRTKVGKAFYLATQIKKPFRQPIHKCRGTNLSYQYSTCLRCTTPVGALVHAPTSRPTPQLNAMNDETTQYRTSWLYSLQEVWWRNSITRLTFQQISTFSPTTHQPPTSDDKEYIP